MKKIMRRSGMTVLFIAAFYMTLTSISNVTFADVNEWSKTALAQNAGKTAGTESSLVENHVSLKAKSLNYINEVKRYISSEEIDGPKTLEEAIHVKQYPSATVIATGYTAGVESTGKSPAHPEYGITYSGVKVTRDLYSTIAADLNVYPIGTILWIPDYGFGVVADKGGAINGNKIDLYYRTVDDVYTQWGKKEVNVRIIKMGEGHLSEQDLKELNNNEALQVFRQKIVQS